jgi:hypothetical protein
MKTSEFRRDGALTIQYRRPREGPPSYLVWEPGKSYICLDRSSLLRAVKWPKYTQTGARLREWLDEVEEKTPQEAEVEPAKMNAEGFGPDVELTPSDNTKMVT